MPEQHLLLSGLITDQHDQRLNRKNYIEDPKLYSNPQRDIGCDILQIKDNEYIIVQCKNGYKSGIQIHHLAGFFAIMSNHPGKYGHIYHTTNKISSNLKIIHKNPKLQFIQKIMDTYIVQNIINDTYELYDYQKNN